MVARVVLLPAPLAPMYPIISPGAIEPAAEDTVESVEYDGRVCFAAIKSTAVPMMIAILTSLDMSALSSERLSLGRCRAG